MQGFVRVVFPITIAVFAFPFAALAQDTNCKTANCAVGTDGGGNPLRPVPCQQVASPRVLRAQMDSAGILGPHQFIPSLIRIEGATPGGQPWSFQCIEWQKTGAAVPWHSSTDATMLSSCQLTNDCLTTSNTSPPCDWETGNIDGALQFSVCHFRDRVPAVHDFQCRLHDVAGMVGTLQIVDPIRLSVKKNAAGDVLLDWSTGGVGPWNVFRDGSAPMPAPINLAPGGTLARNLTDPAFAGDGFYLVNESN